MAGNNTADETNEPEGIAQNTRKADRSTDQAKLVQSLIDGACTTGSEGEVTRNPNSKISNADLLRLMQFQSGMVKEKPYDIVEYRWVDPPKKSER
jgi:hypothetical protein